MNSNAKPNHVTTRTENVATEQSEKNQYYTREKLEGTNRAGLEGNSQRNKDLNCFWDRSTK